MVEFKRGYKVGCRYSDGVLRSATCYGAVLTYEKDKWTKPLEGDGPLAVFKNRSDAEAFFLRLDSFLLKLGNTLELWECAYVEGDAVLPFDSDDFDYGDKGLWFRCGWAAEDHPFNLVMTNNVPKGTAFASRVKLTKHVRIRGGE